MQSQTTASDLFHQETESGRGHSMRLRFNGDEVSYPYFFAYFSNQ